LSAGGHRFSVPVVCRPDGSAGRALPWKGRCRLVTADDGRTDGVVGHVRWPPRCPRLHRVSQEDSYRSCLCKQTRCHARRRSCSVAVPGCTRGALAVQAQERHAGEIAREAVEGTQSRRANRRKGHDMIVDTALREREAKGSPIRVGMVGAGATGRAIALQLGTPPPGIRLGGDRESDDRARGTGVPGRPESPGGCSRRVRS